MFFDNCLYLNSVEREKLENEVIGICEDIKNIIRNSSINVAFYLTGSLARKEPTHIYKNGIIMLASDLDFVLVYDKKINQYNEICCVIKRIEKKYSDYECSFVIIEKNNIKSTNSFFKRDLSLNSYTPIFDDLGIDKSLWGNCVLDKFNAFEAVITQACCYLLNPELTTDKSGNKFFKSANYHKNKLFVECFRAYLYACGKNNVGYNDSTKYIKELSEVYDVDCVDKFLKARECCDFDNLQEYNILQLIDLTCIKIFGNDYCECIVSELKGYLDEIKIFQYVSLMLFMFEYGKITINDFSNIVKDSNFRYYYDVKAFENAINQYVHAFTSENHERLYVEFRHIRNEFVAYLHKKNTAENNFTDVEIN